MINTTIKGIPCQIKVTHFEHVKGTGPTAPSDIDCYGYYEIEFQAYDRKGYRAKWLEAKMTDKDRENIEQLIIDDYCVEEC